ncbi:pentatricopeptide repeat-containing protein At1g15510, chloroplastic isoform X2 [Asparagus officinalis]|uniref:pentatricopeptide repeat-containing protein At1g15510, chloroplastic isoform X2 n=1 Tax=Asparagus officinalis TaxID=4686 RepID=UPI00098E56C6|nr:pentatricopeptide repeat-containing protein At1g15510, chloroplastic isoform X2 [Asparagus officinalis]
MAAISIQRPDNALSLSLPSNPKPLKPIICLSLAPDSNPQLSLNKTHHQIPNPDPNPDPNQEIRRLCVHGDLDKALLILDSSGCSPFDEDAYISLLKLCEWRRAVLEGSRVYSHLNLTNTQLTLRLGNALLSMFVRFGNLYIAWVVFGKMVERDIFSWNVMVGGYAKAGFFDEALDLYSRMTWAGFMPDVYTFPCVLRTCGGVPDWTMGREVHCHVLRFGLGLEIDVLNALITMYAKCGDVITPRKVFDGMLIRDCISWNAMISGYFENDECVEGLRLFLTMLEVSIEPDLMTMTSVIAASSQLCYKCLGKEIHGYAIKKGFYQDVSLCNSLIQMYTSFRNLDEAEKVFSRMESRDVVSWTTMISGYEKNETPERALEVFEQMKQDNVNPDEATIASVLSTCACLGRLDIGMELHELARKKGLVSYATVGNALLDMYSKCRCIDKAVEVFRRMTEIDVISWSSIISGLRINNRSIEALSFFRQMQVDVKPNSITLIAALSACASVGALLCGKEIHAQALRTDLDFDGYLPNALIDLYIKCGRMEYALKKFDVHLNKDVVSYNIMLAGYAGRGQGDLAIELFNQMVEFGVHPDEVTFVALLCACGSSGLLTQGWNYFKTMEQNFAISPNLKHYASMVDLLSRAGCLEEAHQFIKDMPIKPDAAIWGALLNGCRIYRRVELGEVAAKRIFELDSESVGYYVLLCNLYADDGRWDQVARVRKAMSERGLMVDPGCSWVEVKGSVHAFLSGDESHPQINEIRAVLNGLYDRMEVAGFNVSENRLSNQIEASKADIFCGHSERLAVGFGLISSTPGTPIWRWQVLLWG